MLKRLFLITTLASALIFAIFVNITGVFAADARNFKINSFSADYYLSADKQKTSILKVEETIVAEFPSYDQNYGILRAIPKTYQRHGLSLEIQSVVDKNNSAYNYSTYQENDNQVLKIGNGDKYVHGEKVYKITYSMRNVINFQDSDEFYWDINGDQWAQSIGQVTARLHIPKDLAASLQDRQVCFQGSYGKNTQNCKISRESINSETVITSTAANVQPHQTLTVVLAFNKGTFKMGPDVAREGLIALGLLAIVILLPVITLFVMLRRWLKYGRDPKGNGVIIPEYQPLKGFNALSSAFILEESLPTKAVSAAIIELAIKRYITIYEVKKKKFIGSDTDYELQLIKQPSGLAEEQNKILIGIFGKNMSVGTKASISELKNKLYNDVKDASDFLDKDLSDKNYFASQPSKVKGKYIKWGSLALIVGFGLAIFGNAMLVIGFALILCGGLALIFAKAMPARRQAGVTARDYLLGLKEYIKMAESERLKYLQSPKGAEKVSIDINDPKQKVKLFEDLLPYAMLFGLEKDWAKEFEGIYSEPPDWYHGNWTGFRTVYLVSSIGNLNSVSAVAFSPPNSSSSSGFGGGGFSGGGGGGGGGGGW